jgi:hypothetical protein
MSEIMPHITVKYTPLAISFSAYISMFRLVFEVNTHIRRTPFIHSYNYNSKLISFFGLSPRRVADHKSFPMLYSCLESRVEKYYFHVQHIDTSIKTAS